MNANLFARFARAFPPDRTRPFLVTADGRAASYAAMEAHAERFARVLADRGLQPGDRVTVQVAKSPEAVWLYLGCLRGGYVFHPLNDAYREEEIAYLIGDALPALAVCDPRREALFRALAPPSCGLLTLDEGGGGSLVEATPSEATQFETAARRPDDPAVLLYTSGTTGRPKGAVVTHGNLVSNAEALVTAWGFDTSDRLLHALPIYHAHGLFVGLGCTLMSGASMMFLPRFDPRATLAQLGRCTIMMGVPTYYARLLREAGLDHRACSNMRLFISGSAPLPAELFTAFRERTGHAILERYGMTETGMITSNPLDGERRPGSAGLPLPGVTLRIGGSDGAELPAGEIGEVEVKGPSVFPGYWRRSEQTSESFTADGFFRTGDLGRLDADGYLTLTGRVKDLVICGGLNVYPREVEMLIDSLPEIAECAVIGAAHPDFGEAVIAVVVPAPGAHPAEAAIIAQLKQRLAGFKVPKRVFVVPELPRNAMGKVEKIALRSRYAGIFTERSPAP
jgi:malonyl-CoA/methylmalonyl-CoA synthetase